MSPAPPPREVGLGRRLVAASLAFALAFALTLIPARHLLVDVGDAPGVADLLEETSPLGFGPTSLGHGSRYILAAADMFTCAFRLRAAHYDVGPPHAPIELLAYAPSHSPPAG